jgi:hypothetical protein
MYLGYIDSDGQPISGEVLMRTHPRTVSWDWYLNAYNCMELINQSEIQVFNKGDSTVEVVGLAWFNDPLGGKPMSKTFALTSGRKTVPAGDGLHIAVGSLKIWSEFTR